MNWNLEGMRVWGTYLNTFPVSGTVMLSRVKYGGTLSHHVKLDAPLEVFGRIAETLIMEHKEIERVAE